LCPIRNLFYNIKIGELKHLSNLKKIKRDIDSIGERIRYDIVLKLYQV